MTDLELAISHCKRLEALLKSHLKAKGRGLHELTDSVEHKLPAEIVKKLRFTATLRNKIVHEMDYTKLEDRRGFVRAAEAAENYLARIGDKRAIFDRTFIITGAFVAFAFLAGLAIMLYLMAAYG